MCWPKKRRRSCSGSSPCVAKRRATILCLRWVLKTTCSSLRPLRLCGESAPPTNRAAVFLLARWFLEEQKIELLVSARTHKSRALVAEAEAGADGVFSHNFFGDAVAAKVTAALLARFGGRVDDSQQAPGLQGGVNRSQHGVVVAHLVVGIDEEGRV